MKQYYVSAIIQYPDSKDVRLLTFNDSTSSLEDAKRIIKHARNNHSVLSAWVDVLIANNIKQTVLHKCYVDMFGKIEKVEER